MAYDYNKRTVYIDCYLNNILTLFIGKDKAILTYNGAMPFCYNNFTFDLSQGDLNRLIYFLRCKQHAITYFVDFSERKYVSYLVIERDDANIHICKYRKRKSKPIEFYDKHYCWKVDFEYTYGLQIADEIEKILEDKYEQKV